MPSAWATSALTALYLLTVADIRGTSPKVWNAWKGKLLEDLYRATRACWAARARPRRPSIEARKREALVLLALSALPHEAHKKLWDTLDVSYFMRHEAADIAWHTRTCRATWARSSHRARASRWLAKACRCWCTHPTRRPVRAHLRLLRPRGLLHPGRARAHGHNGYALDTFQVVSATLQATTANSRTWSRTTSPTPSCRAAPARAGAQAVSRRVKSFPITPA